MKTPHKHAELIKAWADGAEIEETFAGQDSVASGWTPFEGDWGKAYTVFRVRPEPEPDVVLYFRHCVQWWGHETVEDGDNTKATFNGETGKLIKLEVVS